MARAENNDAERRIDSEQCEIQLKRDNVEHRERGPERKGESAEGVGAGHAPNPMMLFVTCPARNPHQTMKAIIDVRMARVRVGPLLPDRRQQTQ